MKQLLLLLFFWGLRVSFAQNLVANPSFEYQTECDCKYKPTPIIDTSQYYNVHNKYFGSIDRTFWPCGKEVNWAVASTGYIAKYDTCFPFFNPYYSDFRAGGVPVNQWGIMKPHNGGAYTMLVAYEGTYLVPDTFFGYVKANDKNSIRGYLQSQLKLTLEKDKWYCISFWASPTCRSPLYAGDTMDKFGFFGIKGLAAHISSERTAFLPPNKYIGAFGMLRPQIVADSFIINDSVWTKVSGLYHAKGGEEWITIGNFKNNANTEIKPVGTNTRPDTNTFTSLYFIDDVSVEEVSTSSGSSHTVVLCSNVSSVTLSAVDIAEGIEWSTGSIDRSISVSDTGIYWYTAHSAGCGLIKDTICVVAKTFIPLNAGNDTFYCSGKSILLTANQGFDTYKWSNGDTGIAIKVNTGGTYILTASNECGIQKDTIVVEERVLSPIPIVEDTILCVGDKSIILPVTGINIMWYINVADSIGYAQQPGIETRNTGNQQIYVSQNTNGCESVKSKIDINIKNTPEIQLTKDTLFCKNDIGFVAAMIDSSAEKYKWNEGDTSLMIRPTQEGVYTIIAENQCGASAASVRVRISSCENCIVFPNAFTPNGDSRNDMFRAITRCPAHYFQLKIFNRYGQQIFITDNPISGWDGTINGAQQELGIYFYLYQYQASPNSLIEQGKGDISLLR